MDTSHIEWRGDKPFVRFDGTNDNTIAGSMTHFMGKQKKAEITIVVNSTAKKPNDMLVLDQVYADGQIGYDRWRVPLNAWINVRDGGVVGDDGEPADYADLIN